MRVNFDRYPSFFAPNPPPEAMYLIAIKQRTRQLDMEYETAETPAGRYGPHRVGNIDFYDYDPPFLA